MKYFSVRIPREYGYETCTFDASAETLRQIQSVARISIDFCGSDFCIFTAHVKILGGKGGFGRLLKSQKNQGKKTENFDSCRDLQGRREGVTILKKRVNELKAAEENKQVASIPLEVKSKPVVTLDESYTGKLIEIRKEKESAVKVGIEIFSAQSPQREPSVKRLKKTAFDEDSD